MKTKLLPLFIFTLIIFHSQAQVYTYYLNTDLVSVNKKDATVLGKGSKQNDLFRLNCYSISGDILFLSMHFTDSTLAVVNGPYQSFYTGRRIEEAGQYLDNKKEGLWQKWDSSGRKTDSIIYKVDKELYVAHFNYNKNNSLSYASFKDSLLNTLSTFSYDSNSVLTNQVYFLGERGILKTITPGGVTVDSLFTREEEEATFRGGPGEWSRYMRNNLRAETPVENKAPEGTYTVIIKFVIQPDGKISDVEAETNHGYGMEKEAIKLIRNGPKWNPARQYGRFVKAYRRQPVTFVIQKD